MTWLEIGFKMQVDRNQQMLKLLHYQLFHTKLSTNRPPLPRRCDGSDSRRRCQVRPGDRSRKADLSSVRKTKIKIQPSLRKALNLSRIEALGWIKSASRAVLDKGGN